MTDTMTSQNIDVSSWDTCISETPHTSLTVTNLIKPLCAAGSAVLMVRGDKLLVIGSKVIRKQQRVR